MTRQPILTLTSTMINICCQRKLMATFIDGNTLIYYTIVGDNSCF